MVIEVKTVFRHCAKAFRRNRLWEWWADAEQRLILGARYRQLHPGVPFAEYQAQSEAKVGADLAADLPR